MQKQVIRRKGVEAAALDQFKDFHPILARVFSYRGVRTAEELDYQLSYLLPPKLKGIQEAVAILADAIRSAKRILIVGDFDVDGATSTAVAVRCLTALGASAVEFLVPNRFEYGYGLTPEIVTVAAQRKPDIIMTVDNGISSVDGVSCAKALGIQVVVTDHHLPGQVSPDADAIVNPNQHGCEFPSKCAAGVGVVFYVMLALRSELRKTHWFSEQRREPNLAHFLDLVALGTVADVVPLDRNNRILVSRGLDMMRAGKACAGINALFQVGGRAVQKVSATDLGFVAGPRLNAAGRLDDMTIGIRCLLTDDPAEALELAQQLDTLNRERRSIEASMQQDALGALDSMLDENASEELPLGVCFYRGDWHQGVIGILASRMKDRLGRPVIVFAEDDEQFLKGSGRSVPGVHLRDVLDLIAKWRPELLTKFGGHAMAAGLTIEKSFLDEFKVLFAEAIQSFLAGRPLEIRMETDGALSATDFDLRLAEQIDAAGPWGQGFPEPSFDGVFHIVQQRIVGEKHLKLVLAPEQTPEFIIDAIAFNVDVQQWPNPHCQKINAVYKLSVNEFRDKRNLQLLVDYLEPL